MNIIVVPCWSGRPQDNWYPWLTQQLTSLAHVEVLDMPNPDRPCIKAWTETVREHVEMLRPAQIIGHSVGCQAVVRAMAQRAFDGYRPSVLCVAGWFTVDAPWPDLCPWIDTPFDTRWAQNTIRDLAVLLSDNDPFTSDYAENRRRWQRDLRASVKVITGAKHFNEEQAPAVVKAVRQLATRRLFSSPLANLSGNI